MSASERRKSSSPAVASAPSSSAATSTTTNATSTTNANNTSSGSGTSTPKFNNVFSNDGSFFEKFKQMQSQNAKEKTMANAALKRKLAAEERIRKRGKQTPSPSPGPTGSDDSIKDPKTNSYKAEMEKYAKATDLKDQGSGQRSLNK